MRLLVVTAVAAERDAIRAVRPASVGTGPTQVELLIGGVGPAAAAAATASAIAIRRPDLVISAGIAGGFAPIAVGAIAVASSIVFADLGAETADGFAPLSTLGFGVDRYDVAPALAVALSDRTGGHLGTILTVATVTGTAARAHEVQRRHPDAVAEAMEGAGVAAAATLFGVPFVEVRAISNLVGPRERDSWRIPEALAELGRAVAAIVTAPMETA